MVSEVQLPNRRYECREQRRELHLRHRGYTSDTGSVGIVLEHR
jgi:hypothetical protein